MNQINRKKILVVGDIMLDKYIYGSVDRISPEAPVLVLKKDKEFNTLGGATNVCLNLKAASQDVDLISIVGKDSAGKDIKNILKQSDISIKYIIEMNRKTTTKTRFMASNNQQLLRLDEEDVFDIDKKEADLLLKNYKQIVKNYDLVIISDYKKGLLTDYFTKNIIAIANNQKIKVLVDVKDENYEKYKNAYLLKPNKSELNRLTKMPVDNIEHIISASRYLLKVSKVKYVLTTCGKNGMVLVSKDAHSIVDGINKEVYDVTGAGDTAISYLAACLANKIDIVESVQYANIASSIKVTKVGTSTVKLSEVVDEISKDNTNKKIITKEQFRDFSFKDKKVVFTNGCFDIVHLGHLKLLKEAKNQGDVLVVGLNTDKSVKKLKGKERPINNEKDRAEFLSSLDCVDYVILFDDGTPLDLIKFIRPNVLVKGGDYKKEDIVGSTFVEKNGGRVVVVPLVKGKSTTNIIREITTR